MTDPVADTVPDRDPVPVLDLRGVDKSYGGPKALDGVTLRQARGEFVGLLGPNGAGKSTLFQILAGLFAADAGEVRLFGRTHREAGSMIRARLGVVFQARSVDLDMSVAANLRFHGRLYGLSGGALSERIAEVAGRFGLAEMLRRPVRTLSGGQQRRVEIARALMNRPELLILDEPTAGLDATSRAEFVTHLGSLARDQGVAVLCATHLVDEVAGADRIVLLAKGRILADDTPAALCTATGAASLAEVYARLTGPAPPSARGP